MTPAPPTAVDTTRTGTCACCGAAVRPNAPWCTLCLTPTAAPSPPPAVAYDGPPAERAPVDAPPVHVPPVHVPPVHVGCVPVDPLTAPLPQVLGQAAPPTASWPCSACGHPNALELSACAACGSAFLARLASEDAPSLVLPVVGDMRRFERGQPLVLIALVLSGVVVLLVVTAVLGLLLG